MQRDVYILKGEGEEVFEPQFTYHGARYCLVLGLTDEQATEELLTFDICASAIGDRGDFRCSDDTVNKLQAMTRNSDLSISTISRRIARTGRRTAGRVTPPSPASSFR